MDGVDTALVQARLAWREGAYQRGVDVLLPWMNAQLSLQQELEAAGWMATCLRFLGHHEGALPHALRHVELTCLLRGSRSRSHAEALEELSMVQCTLPDAYDAARSSVAEALAIMEELGLQRRDERYGAMLITLAGVDHQQGRYREALATYSKAKAALSCSTGRVYEVLLNNMASCHEHDGDLHQALPLYLEAVALGRQGYGNNHPELARALHNLARTYTQLRQFSEATPLFHEALRIQQRALGEHDQHTVATAERIAAEALRVKRVTACRHAVVLLLARRSKLPCSIRDVVRPFIVRMIWQTREMAAWDV